MSTAPMTRTTAARGREVAGPAGPAARFLQDQSHRRHALVIYHYLAVTAVPTDLHHRVACWTPGDGWRAARSPSRCQASRV